MLFWNRAISFFSIGGNGVVAGNLMLIIHSTEIKPSQAEPLAKIHPINAKDNICCKRNHLCFNIR